MTDYLLRLIERHSSDAPLVRPLVPSSYEEWGYETLEDMLSEEPTEEGHQEDLERHEPHAGPNISSEPDIGGPSPQTEMVKERVITEEETTTASRERPPTRRIVGGVQPTEGDHGVKPVTGSSPEEPLSTDRELHKDIKITGTMADTGIADVEVPEEVLETSNTKVAEPMDVEHPEETVAISIGREAQDSPSWFPAVDAIPPDEGEEPDATHDNIRARRGVAIEEIERTSTIRREDMIPLARPAIAPTEIVNTSAETRGESPTVKVHIGRIEVRTARQPPTPQTGAPLAPPKPAVSLDEYLERRGSRRHE